MQIVFHIGANCTDEERLLKSLLKNADGFAANGIRVPGPGKYRRLLRETIQGLEGANPPPETREILLDAILDDGMAERMLLSQASFLSAHNRVFAGGRLYEGASEKLAAFAGLFPNDDIEIFIGLRNPATWLPALFEASRLERFDTLMQGVDPDSLRWGDLLGRLHLAAPRARLTAWCHEEAPLIWARLIRAMAGLDAGERITGGFDLVSTMMLPDGMRRFLTYLKSHPPKTEAQKRRVIAAFLDKYAIESAIYQEVDLPGWTEERAIRLTRSYEEDIEEVKALPYVTFIGT